MNAEIVVFPFLHNWVQEVKFKYNFITSLFKNKRFVEQRRTMKNLVLREEDLFFTKNEIEKNLLLNKLMYAQDKRIAVPVYPELCFTSTSPLLGESTIVIVENLTEYWNFSNACTHVLIIQDYSTYELIQKNYITANSIVLENAISVTFTGVVEIYPVIFCNMRDIKITHVTSKVYTMGLSFQEIRTYQHTETEEDAQADYLLYNYSKSNPADVVIPDFTIVTNGDITITPTPPPPVETPIIVIVSKDTGGNVLRTQEKVLDENGEVKITKVGDEVSIQIGYKYTNMLSNNVTIEVINPSLIVNVSTTWWGRYAGGDESLRQTDISGKHPMAVKSRTHFYKSSFSNYLGYLPRSSDYGYQYPTTMGLLSKINLGLDVEDFYKNASGTDTVFTFSVNSPSGGSETWETPTSYPPAGQTLSHDDEIITRYEEEDGSGNCVFSPRDLTKKIPYYLFSYGASMAKCFGYNHGGEIGSAATAPHNSGLAVGSQAVSGGREYLIYKTSDSQNPLFPSATYKAYAYTKSGSHWSIKGSSDCWVKSSTSYPYYKVCFEYYYTKAAWGLSDIGYPDYYVPLITQSFTVNGVNYVLWIWFSDVRLYWAS